MRWQLWGASALSLTAFGLTVHAETLKDAMSEAYNSNPQLLAERAVLRETDEGVAQALGGWRPTVQMSGSIGYEKLHSTQIVSVIPRRESLHPREGTANITQPIYEGGRTIALTAEAKNTVEAERGKVIATENQVMFSVAQAYFDVLLGEATVQLNHENEKVLQSELYATKDQFTAGAVTRTDVAEAQARLSAAIGSRQKSEGTLAVSRAEYVEIVGHAPGKLTQPDFHPSIPATRDEMIDRAPLENPAVVAANFQVKAAGNEVSATVAQLLPKISLVGTVTRDLDASQYIGYRSTNKEVLAQMTVPLYEAGVVYSQVREAREKVGQTKNVADQSRRAAVQGATQAWETIDAARASIGSLEEGIRADKVALAGIREEQKLGTRTVLDVLNTEQDLFSVELSLVSAQHDLAVAEFGLAQQLGTLTADALLLPVSIYDVRRHYNSVHARWIGLGATDGTGHGE